MFLQDWRERMLKRRISASIYLYSTGGMNRLDDGEGGGDAKGATQRIRRRVNREAKRMSNVKEVE